MTAIEDGTMSDGELSQAAETAEAVYAYYTVLIKHCLAKLKLSGSNKELFF